MSDIQIIILTACATLTGGVVLLIITELIKSFVVLPVQRTREQIQVALSKLDFHCNMLTNFFSAEPTDEERKRIYAIKNDLRKAATELNSKYTMVPFKRFLSVMRFVPSPKEIDIAYGGLIYLHNSILYEGRRHYIINQIEMNNNMIDRVHAALMRKSIPPMLKPEEREANI